MRTKAWYGAGASPRETRLQDDGKVGLREQPLDGNRDEPSLHELSKPARQMDATFQTCNELTEEVSVDISLINSREQAYILKSIEQAKLRAIQQRPGKRKVGASVRSRTLGARGSGANEKKLRVVPPTASAVGSLGQEMVAGQTLIRSFFRSRKA